MSKTNRSTRDAWKVTPPCTLEDGQCHIDCPYFYECGESDEENDEDDAL